MRYYLGLDPGNTTGIAAIIANTETKTVRYSAAQVDATALGSFIRGLIDAPWYVAHERFTVSRRTTRATRQPLTDRAIRTVTQWIEDRGYDGEALSFPPSDSKAAASNAILRELNLYYDGLPHGNDAMRQNVIQLLRRWPGLVMALREKTMMVERVSMTVFQRREEMLHGLRDLDV